MLFIQSVTNIADPDDGSCAACDDESCCLLLKSTLNSNHDRCSWAIKSLDRVCLNVSFFSWDQGRILFFQSDCISRETARVFIVR
jgi:hypothetical protein